MKSRNTRGESLVETLVAMLIVSLVMLGLATSIVTAAKINRQTEESVRSCQMEKTTQTATDVVTIRWEGGSAQLPIRQYKDNGYYFYEKNP